MLDDHCTLYNAALQERRDAWRTRDYAHQRRTNRRTKETYSVWRQVGGGTTINYVGQTAQLTQIRRMDPDGQGRWSATSQQQTLRRLDKAFDAFFRRVKAGETAGFPRYKSRARFNTIVFVNGDGGQWREDSATVYVKGVGEIRVRLHRQTRGVVKQFSITQNGRHWYVNVMVDNVPQQVRPPTGRTIGVDKGAKKHNLLADSDGGFVPNPQAYRALEQQLACAQQQVARCKRGSKRRRKAVARVAAIHARIKRIRLDHLHKTSRMLVDNYDVISVEKLDILNMVRRPAPKPDPENPRGFLPNQAIAKSALNKTILDAGLGVLQNLIDYKAEEAGVVVVRVNPRNSSRECSKCEHIAAGNRFGDVFRCLGCGFEAHADTNAATIILGRGMRLRDTVSAV